MGVKKEEWSYIKYWHQLRRKENKIWEYVIRYAFCVGIIVTAYEVFLADFFNFASNLESEPVINFKYFTVFSLWQFSFFILICVIVKESCTWKKFYEEHKIFPHTEKVIHLSYILYCFTSMIKVCIVSFVGYMIQVLFGYLRLDSETIILYPFQLEFAVQQFIVSLLYGCLFVSTVIFFHAIAKRTRVPMFVFILIGGAGSILIKGDLSITRDITQFWTSESSIPVFIGKTIISSLIFIIIAYVIYPRDGIEKGNHALEGINLTIVAIFVCISYLAFIQEVIIEDGESIDNIYAEERMTEPLQFQFDVTGIDSKDLKINTELLDTVEVYKEYVNMEHQNKKTVDITISPAKKIINGTDIIDVMRGGIKAELKENTIYIYHEKRYEKMRMIILNPYSFMRQFEVYKDSEYCMQGSMAYSSFITGYCEIILPE